MFVVVFMFLFHRQLLVLSVEPCPSSSVLEFALTISQSINQSINQSKHICIAPYIANETETHNGRDRLSVHAFTAGNIKQFSFQATLKVLRSWADLQLCDSEFQTEEGALTLNLSLTALAPSEVQ